MKTLFDAKQATVLTESFILRQILKQVKAAAKNGLSQVNFVNTSDITPALFSADVISELNNLGFTVIGETLPGGWPVVSVYWPKSSKV